MTWETKVLEFLAASLVRPLVLVGVAVALLRILRVTHPASKHAIGVGVLVGMLVLPFVSVFAPKVEVAALPEGLLPSAAILNVDPRPKLERVQTHAKDEPRRLRLLFDLDNEARPGAAPTSPIFVTSISRSTVPSLRTRLVWIYFAGVFVMIAYRLTGRLQLRRLLKRSRQLRGNRLRESDDIAVPFAVGILHPMVVLPSNWRQWNASIRRSILAHEIAHLRRRDTWTLALSQVVTCLFWFHPVSWWVSRKIFEFAEMACDAIALESVGDSANYARTLLEFSSTVNRKGYRAILPGLAMAGRSPLSRRIEQILAMSKGRLRKLNRPVIVLSLIGLPILGAAATLHLTEVVSRPLLHATRLVAGKLEPTLPVMFPQQARSFFSLGIFGQQGLPPMPPGLQPQQFLDQYCVRCHTPKVSSGDLILEGRNLTQIRQDAEAWEKVARKLRGGIAVPAGQPKPDPTTARNFVSWLEAQLDYNAPMNMPAPGPHRLNRAEYANAIRDLLYLDINPALLLPPDDSTRGFDNVASALGFSTPRPEIYKNAAERIVAAMGGPGRRAVLICHPEYPDPNAALEEPACARRVVQNLATRAYRRPATSVEVEELLTIYDTEHKKASTHVYPQIYSDYPFLQGIDAVLRAVLTDRSFLYRTEIEPTNVASGQSYRISDFELASRLSYFLWSTGPDAQLLDQAARGQLHDPAVLEREARRMLKDPRADALTTNFASQWLALRYLYVMDPTPAYVEFDESLRQAMRRETELFFSSIVQEDRNVIDLLDANYTFLNERLARHYGIPNVRGPEFRRITLTPEFDVRRGLIGKASLLAVASRRERTSITQRGEEILYTLLGVNVPDPPPNVPPMRPQGNRTVRQLMAQELQYQESCSRCHRLFDPYGIALDNFDIAGKWRTSDMGQPIDPVTELSDGTLLNGPASVRGDLLSRSDLFVRHLTERLLTYGLGRGTSYADMPLVRAIARDAAKDNNRFSALVVGIVKSPVFQMNVKN
jgi:hypothetical protein